MYSSVTDLAKKLGVSGTRIRTLIRQGRIKGAFKVGNMWVIPLIDNEMPQIKDGRRGPKLKLKKCLPRNVSRIHVNQNVIRDNNKTGERNPVIIVKQGKRNTYGHEVIINGPCRVVYDPIKGLTGCKAAKVWIETLANVEIIGKEFCEMVEETIVGFSACCGVG